MKGKSIIILLAATISTSLMVWYSTRFYYTDINNSRIEDIITQEVALLEKVKNHTPPCEKINNSSRFTIEETNNFVIIWKISEDNKKLEKFVVNNSFDSAYEEIDNTCK